MTWVATSQVAKKTFFYDQYNNPTTVEEFDYGIGTPPAQPVRRTETDYVTTGEGNGIDYTGSNIASNVNTLPYLRGLPQEQRIYSVGAGGSSTLQAKTHFYYDQFALTARANITGWQSPVTAARGNRTTTSGWVDTTGTWISTTQKFDVAGRVVEATDANGNTSQIDFANSSNTYAFPTAFKTPVPDPSGERGSNARLETLISYDLDSGLVKTTTDLNGQVTTAAYSDSLDRLTGVTYPPGGGSASYVYGDTPGNLHVKALRTQDASITLESTSYFDGLGRTVKSVQSEGSSIINVETIYDALGRVYQQSNPYRTGDTLRWTTSDYDRLSRVITVTLPGGAQSTSIFAGNAVTVTDPAGKSRKTIVDALGRLIQLAEDPGSSPHLNYQTSYTYDALGNLRKVTQGSQARYFMYDSLSRLMRTHNPEHDVNSNLPAATDSVTGHNQWSARFSYQSNGNLSSRTDPRNITCNYIYDALNRVKTLSYQSDPFQTPTIDSFYDGVAVTGAQNSLGRPTKVTATSTNGFSSTYTHNNFDAMGRVLQSTQTTDGNSYPMSYQYDFAGNLISETYPSGRVVSTSFDAAGRISDVSSGTTHYASSFTYAAHGGITSVKLGNDLWEHTTFEPNRLQPTEVGLGTAQGASDRLKLNYDYGPLATNNGNLNSQTITVPTIGSVPGTTLTQCYTYDDLNRLKTAEEKSGANCSGSLIWTQKFIYDQQGNRRFDSGTTIPSGFPNPAINGTNNNRINVGQGYFYDFAGNVTQDPSHGYTFDAESRQTKVDNGATGQYFYDGNGRRVKSVTSAGTTLFVYDAMGKLIAEYTSGNPTGSGTSYITQDTLGTPRVITAQDQSVKARHDYLAFGEEIPAGYGSRTAQQGYVADTLRQKFTGKERDVESGLDYFLARYYASAMGRFCSADSLLGSIGNPQSLNRYAYTLNNPLAFVDPTGHISESAYDGTQEKEKQMEVDHDLTQNLITPVGGGKLIEVSIDTKADYPYILDSSQVLFADYVRRSQNSEGLVPHPKSPIWNIRWVDPTTLTDDDFILENGGSRAAVKMLSRAAQILLRNGRVGLAAERLIAKELLAKGYTILGSHVAARTSDGLRFIDHLVRGPGGELFALEVKSGNATRNGIQFLRDGLMASEGAVLVGKNAPIALRGQTFVLDTIEVLVK